MAGRGCTISVKVLSVATGVARAHDDSQPRTDDESNHISLPVALHAPLSVLKEQLRRIVGIPVASQVLILCDLSDPDRNSDVVLNGRDHETLRDCGIQGGSVLTLHTLGMNSELQHALTKQVLSRRASSGADNSRVLRTAITAAQANHSYNGVVFDVACNGPFEVEVTSVSIAGMLGRVRIFVRNKRWEDEVPTRQSNHWWAHRDSLSLEGWDMVADLHCRPSWDVPLEIQFNKPMKLLPYQRRAIYCHSSLQDDLGIQYQSYLKQSIVASDEYLQLFPGLGHTGSEPFDDTDGWYRGYRCLAGSLRYTAKWKGWTPAEHFRFPEPLRDVVFAMLLYQKRQLQHNSLCANSLFKLPVHVVYFILEFMHYDWFAVKPIQCTDEETPNKKSIAFSIIRRLLMQFGHPHPVRELLHYRLRHQDHFEFDGEILGSADLLDALDEMDYTLDNFGSDFEDDDEGSDPDENLDIEIDEHLAGESGNENEETENEIEAINELERPITVENDMENEEYFSSYSDELDVDDFEDDGEDELEGIDFEDEYY